MPQMMPLYWLSLLSFFILIFFWFNNLNYFNFIYNFKSKKLQKITFKYNWKW